MALYESQMWSFLPAWASGGAGGVSGHVCMLMLGGKHLQLEKGFTRVWCGSRRKWRSSHSVCETQHEKIISLLQSGFPCCLRCPWGLAVHSSADLRSTLLIVYKLSGVRKGTGFFILPTLSSMWYFIYIYMFLKAKLKKEMELYYTMDRNMFSIWWQNLGAFKERVHLKNFHPPLRILMNKYYSNSCSSLIILIF